ncbi:hypothetical protein WA158_007572 [Blastocystis sp. Blastoise]
MNTERISLKDVNPNLIKAEYAIRGAIVAKANEMETMLRRGASLPFDKLVYCNIGNPQSLKQKPITFLRQVLACACYPDLMAINPPLFPSDVVERVQAFLKSNPGGTGAYSKSQGTDMVVKDVANFIGERDGYPCDPSCIYITNGASHAIQNCLSMFISSKADGVLLPIPQYPLYSATITLYGGSQVHYYLDESNGWSMSMESCRQSIQQAKQNNIHVKAIVVINPGNPTGKCFSRQIMEELIEFCIEENIILFADEVYQANIYNQETPFISFRKVALDMGERGRNLQMISFHSISKGFFGECGRRGGYLQTQGLDSEVRAQLTKLMSISLCSNLDGQLAIDVMVNPPKKGQPSYELYEKEKNDILDSLSRRAKKLQSALSKLEGITCQTIDSSLYCFFNMKLPEKAILAAKECNMAPDAFYCMQLLENTGIVTVAGSGFGQVKDSYHVRMTILPPEEDIDEVVNRISLYHQKFLKQYSN